MLTEMKECRTARPLGSKILCLRFLTFELTPLFSSFSTSICSCPDSQKEDKEIVEQLDISEATFKSQLAGAKEIPRICKLNWHQQNRFFAKSVIRVMVRGNRVQNEYPD